MSPAKSAVPVHHDGRDAGPRVVAALTAVAGLVALARGLTFLGVALVLFALVGAVTVAVGPLLTRRTARVQDIVVPRWVGTDAQALAVDQRRLAAHLADADQVRTVVRPRLAALVEARLSRRGVAPDSAEARELLGEPLAAFLTGTRRPTAMSAAAFAALLDRVEAL